MSVVVDSLCDPQNITRRLATHLLVEALLFLSSLQTDFLLVVFCNSMLHGSIFRIFPDRFKVWRDYANLGVSGVQGAGSLWCPVPTTSAKSSSIKASLPY